MDIYLINLDHRTDRMALMQSQLGAMGLEYTRISAINGLGTADIGYPPDHPRLTKGEFACYLSHILCWQALLKSGAERCLILEDDVIFAPEFKVCLNHAPFFAHSGCLTRIECRPFRTIVSKIWYSSFKGVRLRRLMAYEGGAGAYVITRDYAAYMLQNHARPKIPSDDQLFNPVETGFRPHKVFQLDPAPATQRLFLKPGSALYNPESDLQDDRVFPAKPIIDRSFLQKIAAFLKRKAKNVRRNLFHISKTIRFLGEE